MRPISKAMWKSRALGPTPLERTHRARSPSVCSPMATSMGTFLWTSPANTTRREPASLEKSMSHALEVDQHHRADAHHSASDPVSTPRIEAGGAKASRRPILCIKTRIPDSPTSVLLPAILPNAPRRGFAWAWGRHRARSSAAAGRGAKRIERRRPPREVGLGPSTAGAALYTRPVVCFDPSQPDEVRMQNLKRRRICPKAPGRGGIGGLSRRARRRERPSPPSKTTTMAC